MLTGARTLGTTIAALAACLLLLTGCGDDHVKADNAYVAATDRVVRSFETRFQALQADFTPVSTPKQDLQTLAALKAAVDQVAADLRRIEPPDRITQLHATLIARVQGYGPVIEEAQRGFAADDPEAIVAARNRFSTRLDAVAAQVTATITAINAKLR